MRRAPDDEWDGHRLLTRHAGAALVALAMLAACTSSPSGAGDGIGHPAVRTLSGEPMPAIDAATLDGGRISVGDLAGRPVVVNFWATWCDPCRRELPLLAAIARSEGSRVAFVGIDYEDQDGPAREWISRYGVPYANVADPKGELADAFGVAVGLPTTFIVDAQGHLRFRVMGQLDRETLERLLAEVTATPSASAA